VGTGKTILYPVSVQLINQANIEHARSAVNPIGERLVNKFELLIEMERPKVLLAEASVGY
jgi:hypothetical protein